MALAMQVTFDAADPAALAGFWKRVLGYIEEPPPEGWPSWEDWARETGIPEERWNDQSAIVDPDGAGARVYFQRVPEGKTAKNRVHLDVRAAPGLDPAARRARLTEESERLIDLGATKLYELEERGAFWITMQDPEGNEFCLD
ncbi:MAG: VOC family protein [Actinomycetota bacterium]